MDAQQIKVFLDAMASSDLAEMSFSQGDWTLRLVRRADADDRAAADTAGAAAPACAALSQAVGHPSKGAQAPVAQDVLLAPLHGVVYLQPAPTEAPFVTPGQAVRSGQVVCVVEAMKVFNEVHASHDATVASVLVTSGQEVEAGQPLLRFAAAA